MRKNKGSKKTKILGAHSAPAKDRTVSADAAASDDALEKAISKDDLALGDDAIGLEEALGFGLEAGSEMEGEDLFDGDGDADDTDGADVVTDAADADGDVADDDEDTADADGDLAGAASGSDGLDADADFADAAVDATGDSEDQPDVELVGGSAVGEDGHPEADTSDDPVLDADDEEDLLSEVEALASDTDFYEESELFDGLEITEPAEPAEPAGYAGFFGAEAGTGAPEDKVRKSHKKALLITLACIVGALLIAYAAGVVFFSSHFGFHTTIDGADCSYATPAEAESAVSDRVAGYTLTITERESKAEHIAGSSIQLVYVQDGSFEELLATQSPYLWFMRLFPSQTTEEYTYGTFSYDQAAFDTVFAALTALQPANMVAPVDAELTFNTKTSRYDIVAEVKGTTLDPAATKKVLTDAIHALEGEVDLDTSGCYVAPALTSDAPELVELQKTCDTYFPFAVVYDLGDGLTEQLNGTEFVTWYTFGADGSMTLNENAVSAWVSDFAARHNTVGTVRSFTSLVDGQTAEVSGGYYGWEIDAESERAAILALLNTKQTETREPHYLSRAASHGAVDWGTTYIELSIPAQHLYYVVDGAVAYECDVVTGRPPSLSTPEGVYDINSKQSPSLLIGANGPDGEPEYRTWVAYWLAVVGNAIGIHDATWQPYFGGDLYLWNGSHGCINVSYESAADLYGIVEIGTPVIIHY